MKLYPYKKGMRKMLYIAMPNQVANKGFEVVLTRELEVLAILVGGGGVKDFHWLEEGGINHFTLSSGGDVSDRQFSHFLALPSPLINDRSLRPPQAHSRA